MSYVLNVFDGLAISKYIQRGDTQDLGSGTAATAFLSLPGGGFYDNFGASQSQQGIQTLHKGGVLIGTPSELHAQLQAWRAKVGRRGRLTALWDDGSLRWKWARLQDVSAPRPGNAKGGWLPVDLTWIAAASGWRGALHGGAGWTWGDGSWLFGDGTAVFGEGEITRFSLPSNAWAIVLVNEGDAEATDLTLRVEPGGAWTDLTIVNETTGQQVTIDRAAAGTEPWIELNSGARTLWAGSTVSAASVYRDRNYLQVSAPAHGLTTGDSVRLAGLGVYDGDYFPVQTTGIDSFQVTVTPDFVGYGTRSGGTAQRLLSLYSATSYFASTSFSDRKRWLTLVPGPNIVRFTWAPFVAGSAVEVIYNDVYA